MPFIPPARPEVAYFCSEFGLSPGLPFYAGGLGILAGDVVKQADDESLPYVAVGLFYHGKKDRQSVLPNGWQEYIDYQFDPHEYGFAEVMNRDGDPWSCSLNLAGETLQVFALEKRLNSTVTLFFLETDRPENPPHLRDLVLTPYWGDAEQQIRQQVILGTAGVRLLRDMGMLPEVFHLNEGRPALLALEFAAWLREEENFTGAEALDLVKQKMVYTNHTLHRAGNIGYAPDLMRKYLEPYAARLQVSVELLLDLGKGPDGHSFAITEFALRMSRRASGVSQRHTLLCKQEWPEFSWVNITNGVHFPTWQRQGLRNPFLKDEQLWQEHGLAKQDLHDEALERTGIGYNPNALILGWSRRIADYKRLESLFANPERIRQIFLSPERPVQLIVAGKPHPADENGKHLLQRVIQLFQTELSGCALFLPNYDIELAQKMVAGVDVWLNTPLDGYEASGTSGMKASANAVLQATVADGWAAEVDWTGLGWTLDPQDPGNNLFDLLEDEIVPLFYERPDGLPREWIARMRRTQQMARRFSAERMLREYQNKLYA